ncbi:MAG: flagellar protein [Lachnospiraceae bacterium]|nr:flagellar protein [Lachnospiraceae bacterium]
MNNFDSRILSIEQATGLFLQTGNKTQGNTSAKEHTSFQDILAQKSEQVRFSKHANQRLESRNITLSDNQMDRLSHGIDQARGKSINESLVMMDNLAFIVNIKNNTVVTALEQGEEGNVFTNIDGAVIV